MKNILIFCILVFELSSSAQTKSINDEVVNVADSIRKIQFKVIDTTIAAIPFAKNIGKDLTNPASVAPRTVFIKAQNTKGNIIISTTEKLSFYEYYQLILSLSHQYKQEYGKKIIIKAQGYKTLRTKIGKPKSARNST